MPRPAAQPLPNRQVYFVYFKTNRKLLRDYEHIREFVRELYGMPGATWGPCCGGVWGARRGPVYHVVVPPSPFAAPAATTRWPSVGAGLRAATDVWHFKTHYYSVRRLRRRLDLLCGGWPTGARASRAGAGPSQYGALVRAPRRSPIPP
jgi:hypothetical protein